MTPLNKDAMILLFGKPPATGRTHLGLLQVGLKTLGAEDVATHGGRHGSAGAFQVLERLQANRTGGVLGPISGGRTPWVSGRQGSEGGHGGRLWGGDRGGECEAERGCGRDPRCG